MTPARSPEGSGRPAAAPATPARRPSVRLLFLLPGGASLILGLIAALVLIGVLELERFGPLHAPLLVFGFVGTLIVLERAVAIRQGWAYLGPALLGLGSLSLLAPIPDAVGKSAIALGFLSLLASYIVVWRRQPAAATAIQVLGAVAALATVLLWLGGVPVRELIPGMVVFLVLTIAGERLELGRISPAVTKPVEAFGVGVSMLLTASVIAAPLWPLLGYPLLGAALLALVAWAARFDVAVRLVRASGLPRFMAVCLLAGYAWLVVAGLVWLVLGQPSGWAYDTVVHAVFLGFVMSMIMAHAPVILPAVLRVELPYRPFLYLPVALLHVTLALRVLANAREWAEGVQAGGIGNIVAILLFVVLAVMGAKK